MRNFFVILVTTLWLQTFFASAQSNLEIYQNATFLMNDSSIVKARVNAKSLLTSNVLEFEQKSGMFRLQDVRAVTFDSTRYIVNRIENMPDTIKLMELVQEGKLSLYRSPRISTNNELFVSKDGKVYQLRMVRKYIRGSLVEIREFASYMHMLTLDCDAINHRHVEDDLGLGLPSISRLVRDYNKSCGWEVTHKAIKERKPRFSLDLVVGGMFVKNNLSYGQGFRGSGKITGFFAGPSISMDTRKFNDVRLRLDIFVEQLSGTASARGYETHNFDYNILQLKKAITFNFKLKKDTDTEVYVGLGSMFQTQLSNKTAVTRGDGYVMDRRNFYSKKDKFNMSPVAHLEFRFKRLGFRYQVAALSVEMKSTQLFGFEHRGLASYRISK